MSATRLAQTVGALVALLQAAPAVCPQVHRSRVRPLPESQASAIVVRALGATCERGIGYDDAQLWTGEIALECYARGSDAAPVDTAVDALAGAAIARVMTDQTLGGSGVYVNPHAVALEFDIDAQQTACITVRCTVQYTDAP